MIRMICFFMAMDYNFLLCNPVHKSEVELIVVCNLLRRIFMYKSNTLICNRYRDYFKMHNFLANPHIQADSKLYAEVLKSIV